MFCFARLSLASFLLTTLVWQSGYLQARAQVVGGPDEVEYRTVRTTVGSETVTGWWAGMVEGDKNLGHYFWSPITSYKQGTAPLAIHHHGKGRPDSSESPDRSDEGARTGYQDSKPVRITRIYERTPYTKYEHSPTFARGNDEGDVHGMLHSNNLRGNLLPHRSTKPQHLPLPVNEEILSAMLSHKRVGSSLLRHRSKFIDREGIAGKLMHPSVASYPEASAHSFVVGSDGRISRAEVSGVITKRGRLLSN